MSQNELVENDAKVASSLSRKVKTKNKKEAKATKPHKKRKASESANSLNLKKLRLSEDLQKIVGEPEMARTQIVKKVWEHIKDNQLQNPDDRREIFCDDLMKPVFGEKTTMFALNKSLSNHILKEDETVQPSKTAEDSPTVDSSA